MENKIGFLVAFLAVIKLSLCAPVENAGPTPNDEDKPIATIMAECLMELDPYFGTKWINEIKFNSTGHYTEVPMAFACFNLCQDKKSGMIDKDTGHPTAKKVEKYIRKIGDDKDSLARKAMTHLKYCLETCYPERVEVDILDAPLNNFPIGYSAKDCRDVAKIDLCASRCSLPDLEDKVLFGVTKSMVEYLID